MSLHLCVCEPALCVCVSEHAQMGSQLTVPINSDYIGTVTIMIITSLICFVVYIQIQVVIYWVCVYFLLVVCDVIF